MHGIVYGGRGDRRPPPSGSPQPGILIVKNYPEKTSDDELRQLFERFGKLREGPYRIKPNYLCVLMFRTVFSPLDKETKQVRGFTFVKFFNPEDAESALKAMEGTVSELPFIFSLCYLNGCFIRTSRVVG